jgi:DNA-binding NarL/FixJ family response regulator
MTRPISVVVAEDCLLVRDSVCRALSTDPDVTVVGIGVDYDSTVELLDRHKPTLLVTDVRMPPTSIPVRKVLTRRVLDTCLDTVWAAQRRQG